MQTKTLALEIVDRLLEEAVSADKFSYVAIKAKTISDIMQVMTDSANHAMPTACHALRERFRPGKDYFRRGKDRDAWLTRIPANAGETSTYEVLFEVKR